MSLDAGRVGVRPDQVDVHGRINPRSDFITNLLNDLPVWTDLPVWKSGTEQVLPVNDDEPETAPILTDIEYPVADLQTDQYFTYRQSPAQKDGLAKIRGIRGKTLVWNQLNTSTGTSKTDKGVTFTNLENGFFTIVGTATDDVYFDFKTERIDYKAGHKYAILGITTGTYDTYYFRIFGSNYGGSYIANVETDDFWTPRIYIKSGATIDLKVAPAVYDLTLMFGAGKEPTTVKEFTDLFPLPYYKYDTGSLLDFKGTKLKTTNSNLGLFPTGRTNNGVTFTCNGSVMTIKGKATANATPWGTNVSTQYASMPIGPLPAGVYTITTKGFVGVATNDRIIANGIYNDGSNAFSDIRISGKPSEIADGSGRSYTVTCSKPFKMGFYCQVLNGGTFDCEVKLMVNAGSTALPYVDHDTNETDLPISTFFPTGMKSAGAVYDELTPTRAITRVGQVDLGSLTWTATTNNRYITTGIASLIKAPKDNATVGNIICPKYATVTYSNIVDNSALGIAVNGSSANKGNICIRDTGTYADASAFKTAMSGVMLNYELAVEDVQPTMSFDSE